MTRKSDARSDTVKEPDSDVITEVYKEENEGMWSGTDVQDARTGSKGSEQGMFQEIQLPKTTARPIYRVTASSAAWKARTWPSYPALWKPTTTRPERQESGGNGGQYGEWQVYAANARSSTLLPIVTYDYAVVKKENEVVTKKSVGVQDRGTWNWAPEGTLFVWNVRLGKWKIMM